MEEKFYLVEIHYLDGNIENAIYPADEYNEKLAFNETKKIIIKRSLSCKEVIELTGFDPKSNKYVKKA